MFWQVYILYSEKLGRYYTGCTHKLESRLEQHRVHYFGNASFTAKADDWALMLTLDCRDEQHAKSVEKYIKGKKSSKYIASLVANPAMQQQILTSI